jgi:serine protease Do
MSSKPHLNIQRIKILIIVLNILLLSIISYPKLNIQGSQKIDETIIENITSFNSLLPTIYDNAKNSVVSITVQRLSFENNKQNDSVNNNSLYNVISSGSGFIINNDGHIVTNYHVVKDSKLFNVRFLNGNSYSAVLIGKDPFSDIAVLQLNPSALFKQEVVPLSFGSSSTLKIGQQVVAIGNPAGFSGTMSEGIISQLNIVRPDYATGVFRSGLIQTDVPLASGSSGGPLIDMTGKVIGVTSSQSNEVDFISFAIPSDKVIKIATEIIKTGVYKNRWLGINGIDITPDIAKIMGLSDTKGLIVKHVTKGSPAYHAGITAGNESKKISLYGQNTDINSDADVIIGIDNITIRYIGDMLNYLDTKSIGENVTLKAVKNMLIKNISVKIAERSSN